MKGYPDRRYHAAVIAIARAAFVGDRERLDAAVAQAIALVPIRNCEGCGRSYLRADGRQRRWCSARCRWRIAQRERRRRTKAEAAQPEVPAP